MSWCSAISCEILICSNAGYQLTIWTHSAILISGPDPFKHWRATHKLDMCSVILINKSDPPKNWRATHKLGVDQPFLSVVLICSNTGVTHKLDTCSAILVSGSDFPKCWRVTHFLDAFPIYLISKIHVNFQLSYRFVLQKALIRFQQFTSRDTTYILPPSCKPKFSVIQQDIHSHSEPHVNLKWHRLRSKLVSHSPFFPQLPLTLFWNGY